MKHTWELRERTPFHRRSGTGAAIVLLHGLLGSNDNWGTVARDLAEDHEVVLVDLRDHGRSPHTGITDHGLMAEDVHALFTALSLKNVLLAGHSMGGKAAMVFAQRWPELLKALVIVDIGPREYPIGDHATILEALRTSGLSTTGSRQGGSTLGNIHPRAGVVQFLMKSLYWEAPGR